MLSKQNLLTLLKWILAAFFTLLIIFELFHFRNSISSQRRTIVLITLTIILLYKNKFTWLIGIILSAYGWYYLAAVADKYSEYVSFDFTARLKYMFKPLPRTMDSHIIQGFPFYYYFISFVVLLTPLGRKWYSISFKSHRRKSLIN